MTNKIINITDDQIYGLGEFAIPPGRSIGDALKLAEGHRMSYLLFEKYVLPVEIAHEAFHAEKGLSVILDLAIGQTIPTGTGDHYVWWKKGYEYDGKEESLKQSAPYTRRSAAPEAPGPQ